MENIFIRMCNKFFIIGKKEKEKKNIFYEKKLIKGIKLQGKP